jgi:hypothetical protein
MLPARIARKEKRESRWKSTVHRNWIRGFTCCRCGSSGPIEVAHVRIGSNAGMGQKPDDWRTVPLCGGEQGCHALQHRMGERTFWDTHEKETGQDVESLIEAFCKASPKAREIMDARNG